MGSPSGLAPSPSWTIEGNQASAWLGHSVSTAGDVNGDGFSDVIVGAPSFDNGQPDEGRAWIHLGGPGGLAVAPAWVVESGQAGARLGNSVGSAGDVNGDGYGDVIVGASRFDNGEVDEGRALVYLGSPLGVSASPAWTAESDQASASFGYPVATAGDVDGDGYGDVIIGAFRFDNGELDEGRAYLFLGSSTGLAASPAWIAECDQADAHLGFSAAAAGDLNGDGHGDLIVGAKGFDGGQLNEGAAFVYLGNGDGAMPVRPRQLRSNAEPMAILGRSNELDAFRLSAEFRRALAGFSWARPGAAKARMQWDVVRAGETFDSPLAGESATQAITGSTLFFDEIVDDLNLGSDHGPSGRAALDLSLPYAWRARIRTDNPLFPTTPWFTVQATAPTEAKFRTKGPARRSGPPGITPP
jgi:hypothetical protein